MRDFYRIRFLMTAKDEYIPDFFEVLIASIKKWLVQKYGTSVVEKIIDDWGAFTTGGEFGYEKQVTKFCAETVNNTAKLGSAETAWACRITEYPMRNPKYIPRKWITEIGYQSVSEKVVDISYSVKYEDLTEYSGQFLPTPTQNIPKVAMFLLNSKDWICSINDCPVDANTLNNGSPEGILFGVEDCRALVKNGNIEFDEHLSMQKKCEDGPQIGARWISLCKVNRPDRNQNIWMQRLADAVDGVLVAPIFDETKEKIFDNRALIFCDDGPKDPGNIGFWEWTERQSESGRWLTDATYIEHQTPIEIITLDKLSSIDEVVETLKTGLYIPAYVRCNILFAVKKDSFIEGILCDLSNFNIYPDNDLFITLKNNIYTLPCYELKEHDIFTWKYRKIYKRILLDEPKKRIKVYALTETIKQMLLQRMNWPVFKAQNISKSDWQKFKQFLNELPKDSILERLCEMYDMSLQEARNCVDSFLQTVEKYVHVEDIDSTLIVKMLDNHERLKQTCNEFAYKKWCEEHKAEIENAKEEVAAIRIKAEQELAVAKQHFLDIEKSTTSAKEEYNNILSEITKAQSRLEHLHTEIAQYEALGRNALAAVRQKISDAQKDMASFIADLSIFLPQIHGTHEPVKRTATWMYSCAPDNVYSVDDIDQADDWNDEFNSIYQNLSRSLSADSSVDSDLRDFHIMLTAFLYASHINNVPLLIAGPCGCDIAEILSVSLYANGTGQLTLGNECDYDVVNRIKEYNENIVVVQNMFGRGWNDELPQVLYKLKKHVIWSHPYVEDMVIEPKGLYNYMLPILSESFVGVSPDLDLWPGKRSDNFKAYPPRKEQPLRIAAFEKLGLSKLIVNKIKHVLTDAKAILDNPIKDKDMEILFGLLPFSVLTGRVDVLKEVIETESGVSDSVKVEAARYIKEE